MKAFHSQLLLAALLLVTTPAHADNEISLRFSNGFYSSRGLDLFSTNNQLSGAELGYARELVAIGRSSLWAEASWLVTSSDAKSFAGALESQGIFQVISVGLVYRLHLWRWLVPQARVGVGPLIGNIRVTPPAGGSEISDFSGAFAGQALLGVELLWPRARLERHDLNFGLVLEGGYSFSSAMTFELTPSRPEELRAIPVQGVGLGSLVLHGGQLRIGVVLRF